MTEDSKKKRILWILCLCEIGAMLICYNLAAVIPILRTEWSISNDQAGALLSVFQLGYVIAAIFTGWLADKYGGRLIFALSAIETGLAGLGFILFADNYQSALWWRALAGLGQGGLYIPGIRILSSWYSRQERGRIIGIFTCANVFAYAGAYYLASALSVAYSWQTGLFWTTIWAFPAALAVFFLVHEKKTISAATPLATAEKKPSFTLASKAFWLIIVGYVGHMWELYAFWGWLGAYVTYAFTSHGYDTSVALRYGGTIAAVCTAMGGISPGLGGWVSDKYGRCLSATTLMLISGCCALLFGWLADLSLWLLIIVGLVYGFFIVADSAIFKAGLTELVPAHAMGSALGVQSVLGFGITVITPRLFGMIVDNYSWGWAFSFLAIGPFLGIICMLLLRGQPEAWRMASGKR
ncbi:MFS transporter [Sporomusa acidovorans]|uniref:Hexuronate transporter n=1 Tax=Sporomusa acidovorans (strain ATCC 49682 / DSM 3132 / Mol) TaxID=1123286 RepID=A0ABZ3J6F4_SPOA4|nr:MFS transporter [Sporomusa acidovorans]OZC24290.1 hexuronate transporter [Sporomusa acidovorans DSM 3132]SDF02857.1 Sugar phosphate permease [Sporomusa acidovorans]